STMAADAALEDAEQMARVRAAVDALPERLRSVVMLCTFSELSYAEVAQVLEIPAGTVASRKNKAMAVLRSQLEDGNGGSG
ncbi:MAG: sigma-70 family RNA polymerase sigma factor, partial [Oligoflexia bacterium]|nr:sigma-70 family RNA polymerase sigma factor [Oligoflexia bacterium]